MVLLLLLNAACLLSHPSTCQTRSPWEALHVCTGSIRQTWASLCSELTSCELEDFWQLISTGMHCATWSCVISYSAGLPFSKLGMWAKQAQICLLSPIHTDPQPLRVGIIKHAGYKCLKSQSWKSPSAVT